MHNQVYFEQCFEILPFYANLEKFITIQHCINNKFNRIGLKIGERKMERIFNQLGVLSRPPSSHTINTVCLSNVQQPSLFTILEEIIGYSSKQP